MDIVLPKEIAYSPSLPSLPECNNTEVVLAPVNGATFGPSQLIQIDIPSRGLLDPSSMYVRYKETTFNSTGSAISVGIKSIPLYTFFTKLETIIGSQIVESINNYGQVCAMWCNLTMDMAQKYGAQYQLGLSGDSPTTQDGSGSITVSANGSHNISLAGVLPNILQSAEKLVPLEFMPNVRIQLTTASIAEAFGVTATAPAIVLPSNYSISNFELCYNQINFTGNVYDMIRSMGEKFYIKSQSWANMGASVSSGVVGTTELVYNARYSSVKSLFALLCGTSANCMNGVYDSIDLTANNGSYQFSVAGTNYPSRELSTINNKAGVMAELRKAVGGLHTGVNSTSINRTEFSYVDGGSTTLAENGKFIVGVNTEKLSTNNALLTGISTQNSPITFRIQNGNQTTYAYTVYLVALYDILIEVQPDMKNATVKQ